MDREKIIVKTSVKGIAVNIILVIFKAIVGLIANSIAIILDAVNNFSDALSSIITIIGIKLAGKAPDKKHPYGHGRIEYFSSIIIGIIVLAAGLTALKESVEKIISPALATYSAASLIIVAVAVIVKFFFGRYVKKIGENINSGSLVASGSDAIFDSVLSFSSFVTALISIIFKISLEGIVGALISVIIIKSSIEMLKETIDTIIGLRVESELANKLKEIINSYDEVEGTYDLMLHNYGPTKIMGSVHIQVADNMTAKEIHILTRTIELKIFNELGIILTIGIYASNTSDEKINNIKKELESIIKNYPSILQFHGFYVDTNVNLISFDLIIDFDDKNPEQTKEAVIKEIKEKYPDYNYFAVIDTDFSD